MKPPIFLTCILIFISTLTALAQPPEKFTYQAVIRDSNSTIIRNTNIGLRLSVLRDSSTSTTPLYSETHNLTTTNGGLITTEIGGGTVQSGDFSSIMWGDGIYFIKTEIDVDGGTDYGISGVTRVLSVPFALYSNTSRYSDSSRVARMFQRMTTSQRDSIKNPEIGLQIFNLTSGCLELNLGSPINPEWFQIGCARVNSLLCSLSKLSNPIYEGDTIDMTTIKIPYLGGNGGYFTSDTIESAEVPGITAIIESGYLSGGNDSIQINLEGVPMGNGIGHFFPLSIGNQTCSLSFYVGDTTNVNYSNGYVHCNSLNPTEVAEVWNPVTNKIWMDRNLGAIRVAQSSTDTLAYGDLFQWGRFADGHQCRDSDTTNTNATTAEPNAVSVWDGKFIKANPSAIGQKLFFEGFDEVMVSTTGPITGVSDEGVPWSAMAYGIEDGFGSDNNRFFGTDTDGEVTWTTGPIDVGEYAQVVLTVDFSDEGSDLESGCNIPNLPNINQLNISAVDYIDVFFSYDDQSYAKIATPFSCSGGCPNTMNPGDRTIFGDCSNSDNVNDLDFQNYEFSSFIDVSGYDKIYIRIVLYNSSDSETISFTNVSLSAASYDWLENQDNNLWLSTQGVNNPCPIGFRLPTDAEWDAERLSWPSDNSSGAFASLLKLPKAGYRNREQGWLVNEGIIGRYWSSSTSNDVAIGSIFSDSSVGLIADYRAHGFSIRCIKD